MAHRISIKPVKRYVGKYSIFFENAMKIISATMLLTTSFSTKKRQQKLGNDTATRSIMVKNLRLCTVYLLVARKRREVQGRKEY